jgi:hypothetical protein
MQPDEELIKELDAMIRKNKEDIEALKNLLAAMQPKPVIKGGDEPDNSEEEKIETKT